MNETTKNLIECQQLGRDLARRSKLHPGDEFDIGTAHYRVDRFGVISQLPPFEIQKYDVGYVATRYDTIPESVANLSHLRAGYLLGLCAPLASVLDVGYGNGGFLRAMQAAGVRCCGTDISGYPVPEGCEFMPWKFALNSEWDLVTFFDSLEHFPTLDWLGDLRAKWVAITVPCVKEDANAGWLAKWKHLRPGEHLHHFRPSALDLLMRSHGFRGVAIKALEDLIRRPGEENNTFTALYRRIE